MLEKELGAEMIHYHGGPITPDTVAIRAWTGRHAFISYAAPRQIRLAAQYCQSFALDNGAYSFWKSGTKMDWQGYYQWVAKWKNHPGFDFAVIPDVIDGTEEENDRLLADWPHGHAGAPVWHVNESLERLERMAQAWPRVCIGSSGEYDVNKSEPFLQRMHEAISTIIDDDRRPICKLHGLRMLNPDVFTRLPLGSADSTNVARSVTMDNDWRGMYSPKSKEARATVLVERIEGYNSAHELGHRPYQFSLMEQLI